uniref:Ankyrin repeat protein n=1 Tax=viral metagenome TaxID=1070528 RepID=A0A6C0J6Y3_9ZZZZ
MKKTKTLLIYVARFLSGCYDGQLEIVKWTYSIGEFTAKEINNGFMNSFEKYHINIAKWLYSNYNNIHTRDAFLFCCEIEFMEGVKWLYSLDNCRFNGDINDHFNLSCCRGNLILSKWLYSLGGVDIHYKKDQAFSKCCFYGYLEIAIWLHGLGGINIHDNNEDAFQICCINGNLLFLKWLYSLGNVDIRSNNDMAFYVSCSDGYLQVAQWLATLCKDYHIEVDNDGKIINFSVLT